MMGLKEMGSECGWCTMMCVCVCVCVSNRCYVAYNYCC